MDAILHTPNIDITQDATATASQILSGYTAYVKGVKLSGSMVNRGNVSATLNAGNSYVIPEGYHTGAGRVTANSLASQTSATATAAQILSGYTAWVNGQNIMGSLNPLNFSIDKICSFGWSSYPMVNWSSDYKVGNGILVYVFTRNYSDSGSWAFYPTHPDYITYKILPSDLTISDGRYFPIETNGVASTNVYHTAVYVWASVGETGSMAMRLYNSTYTQVGDNLHAGGRSGRYFAMSFYL